MCKVLLLYTFDIFYAAHDFGHTEKLFIFRRIFIMTIYGFQKMTLLDYPGKVACTLFTGGCNFRCPFCHNAMLVTELDRENYYTDEEIFDYLKKRVGILDGVCITGGEPLMNDDIDDFIRRIRELGYSVKLDTNGSYPEKLKKLIDDGLVDYVAMDIKNTPEKYAETIGVKKFDFTPVKRSIDLLMSGSVPYEFRTTVVNEFHTVQDIEEIAKMIAGAQGYFLQNFVDSGSLIGADLSAVSKDNLEKMRETAAQYVVNTGVRGV